MILLRQAQRVLVQRNKLILKTEVPKDDARPLQEAIGLDDRREQLVLGGVLQPVLQLDIALFCLALPLLSLVVEHLDW